MEIILGRDPEKGQLKVIIGQQSKNVGPLNAVPKTVSRLHCSLTTEEGGQFRLKNLKMQNVEFRYTVNSTGILVEDGTNHEVIRWDMFRKVKETLMT